MIKILQNISSQNNLNLIEAKRLSGGDINAVYRLDCKEGKFVIKLNNASSFPGMFTAEAKGLQLLRNSKSFKIPKAIASGSLENHSYLIMEYISTRAPKTDFWELFAQNLAKLHRTKAENFGLDHDNFIGSLPQKNNGCATASEFYMSQRLEPQIKMASNNGFEFKKLKGFYKNTAAEIPNEPPSLIHGDLWSGNFLVAENGKPALIDPAVGFAPREMDLAMMKLFGGFDSSVFNIYNSIFPPSEGWENRTDLWQLYYLLVHLNLFGSGYFSQIKAIVSKYS